MTHVPATRTAQLPKSYEAAKQYLAECESVDECKEWGDKAAALASYSRQANDKELEQRAMRIRARAIRRAGELLKQLDGRGGDRTKSGGTPTFAQSDAAAQAGMSKDQQVTAVRVANVGQTWFEQAIESDDPPTVTALAEQGKKKRRLVDLGGIDPKHYAKATELQGSLRRLAQFCAENDPRDLARAFQAHERGKASEWVDTINAWVDIFVVNLKEDLHDESK